MDAAARAADRSYEKLYVKCIFFDTIWHFPTTEKLSFGTPSYSVSILLNTVTKSRYLSTSAEVLSQFAKVIKKDIQLKRNANNAVRFTDWSKVDLRKLRRWFGDVNRKPEDFLAEFGVKYERIYAHRKKLNLPPRPRIWRNFVDDPTPEEIAERAAECRQRHFDDIREHGQPEPQPRRLMAGSSIKDPTPFKMFCEGVL